MQAFIKIALPPSQRVCPGANCYSYVPFGRDGKASRKKAPCWEEILHGTRGGWHPLTQQGLCKQFTCRKPTEASRCIRTQPAGVKHSDPFCPAPTKELDSCWKHGGPASCWAPSRTAHPLLKEMRGSFLASHLPQKAEQWEQWQQPNSPGVQKSFHKFKVSTTSWDSFWSPLYKMKEALFVSLLEMHQSTTAPFRIRAPESEPQTRRVHFWEGSGVLG